LPAILKCDRWTGAKLAANGANPHIQGMKTTEPDIEILGPEDAERKQERIKARFWPTVRKALNSVPFMDEVVAGYYAMLDPQTPRGARLTLVAALAYFVMPVDMIPDFLAGLGFVDDASVLTAALAAVSSAIRPEHREAAKRALEKDLKNTKP
jgi:uncharacterized membrane protein YkvA (DUF1232 family)